MREELRSELLSAYHDGELPAVERSDVERLLADDESARRELEELQELSTTLSTFGTDHAPDGLHEAVMRRVERESLLPSEEERRSVTPATSRRSPVWVPVVAGLATVAAALLIAVRIGSFDTEREEGLAARTPTADEDHTVASNMGGNPVEEEAAGVGDLAESRSAEVADAEGLGSSETEAEDSAVAEATAPQPPVVSDPAGIAAESVGGARRNGDRSLGPAGRKSRRDGRASLEFDDDLERVDVGDVVRALETRDGEVAVVRLTVVDRRQGLEALQLLLARNDVVRDDVGPAGDSFGRAGQDGDTALEAVYVEATEDQLAKTLEQLRSYETFKSLDVGEPVVMARLEENSGGFTEDRAFALADLDRKAGEQAQGAGGARSKEAEKADEPSRPVEPTAEPRPALAALDALKMPADESKPAGAPGSPKQKKNEEPSRGGKPGERADPNDARREQPDELAPSGERLLAGAAAKRAEFSKVESLEKLSRQRGVRVPAAVFLQRDFEREERLKDEAPESGETPEGNGSVEVEPDAVEEQKRRSLPVVFVIVLDEAARPAERATPATGPDGA